MYVQKHAHTHTPRTNRHSISQQVLLSIGVRRVVLPYHPQTKKQWESAGFDVTPKNSGGKYIDRKKETFGKFFFPTIHNL